MKLTYLLLNFFTVLIPLARSNEPKIQFYSKLKLYFPGMLFTAIFFITWDYFKTRYGVWGFNDHFIIGIKFFGLPLEELLFFFTVPYACLFIYEVVSYFAGEKIPVGSSRYFTCILSAVALVTSFFFYSKAYTFSVLFIGGIIFPIASLMLNDNSLNRFYITYLVCLLPMAIVNGFLTGLPVVIYNDTQNLNIRVGSIPLEDFAYCAILLVMNIALYEWEKQGRPIHFKFIRKMKIQP